MKLNRKRLTVRDNNTPHIPIVYENKMDDNAGSLRHLKTLNKQLINKDIILDKSIFDDNEKTPSWKGLFYVYGFNLGN